MRHLTSKQSPFVQETWTTAAAAAICVITRYKTSSEGWPLVTISNGLSWNDSGKRLGFWGPLVSPWLQEAQQEAQQEEEEEEGRACVCLWPHTLLPPSRAPPSIPHRRIEKFTNIIFPSPESLSHYLCKKKKKIDVSEKRTTREKEIVFHPIIRVEKNRG